MTEAEAFLHAHGIDPAAMTGYAFTWDIDDVLCSVASSGLLAGFRLRQKFIARFGFAVLTERTVAAITKYSPFLEIGAGSGYWAHELRKAGADVIATDPGTGRYGCVRSGWQQPYVDIERMGGVEAVAKYPHRALLMVWPDYDAPWAAEALRAFDGTTVLYVGEGHNGCTGDAAFHEWLDRHYALKEEIDIPNFDGIRDRLEIYTHLGGPAS